MREQAPRQTIKPGDVVTSPMAILARMGVIDTCKATRTAEVLLDGGARVRIRLDDLVRVVG